MRRSPTTALESDTVLRACMHSWAWLQTALPTLSTSISLLVTALGVLATALALGIGFMAFEDRTGSATIPFESAVLAHVHTTRLRVPFGVDARMSSTLLKVTNDFEHGLTQVRLSPTISTRSRLQSRTDLDEPLIAFPHQVLLSPDLDAGEIEIELVVRSAAPLGAPPLLTNRSCSTPLSPHPKLQGGGAPPWAPAEGAAVDETRGAHDGAHTASSWASGGACEGSLEPTAELVIRAAPPDACHEGCADDHLMTN
jgi:hypothetical protein